MTDFTRRDFIARLALWGVAPAVFDAKLPAKDLLPHPKADSSVASK